MFRTRISSRWWLLAVVLLCSASAAHALNQARLYGTITDENKKPIEGIQITVTCPEIATFKLETVTDHKGNWAVTILDATKSYNYKYEKSGYQTMQQDLKVPIGSNDRKDFTMLSNAEAIKRGAAVETPQEPTPEEKAVVAFNEGAEAFGMGDLESARAKFQESVTLNPNLAFGFLALAKLNSQEGKLPQVVEMAERVVQIEPTNAEAHSILLSAYTALGDENRAAAARKRLGELSPEAGKAFLVQDTYNSGVRAYNAGDTKAALSFFEKALDLDPNYPKAHYMLGMCLISQGENAKAREHLEAFIAVAEAGDADAATAKEMLSYLK